jgi:excisionase family DNA binding protein
MQQPPTRETSPDATEQLLFTPEEAADILRVSAYRLKVSARRREIPHRRIGVQYRFSREDLEEIKDLYARPVTKRRTKQRESA